MTAQHTHIRASLAEIILFMAANFLVFLHFGYIEGHTVLLIIMSRSSTAHHSVACTSTDFDTVHTNTKFVRLPRYATWFLYLQLYLHLTYICDDHYLICSHL